MSSKTLTARQMAQMKRSNEDRLSDRAVIVSRTDTLDAVGQPVATWTDVKTIDCAFGFSPFKFRSRELDTLGGEESSEILVRARVPIRYQSDIDTSTRLRLIARYGTTLDPAQTYEVQGFNEIGPSGMVVNLKRVEL